MLTQLRNYAQTWVIKGLLLVIVVTFVISFGAVNLTNRKEVLVTVDGKEILVSTYLQQYEKQLDALRKQYGENTETVAQRLNLRQRVMDDMIDRSLILDAADRMGLRVTDREMADSIAANEVFQIDKRFNQGQYLAVLRQNGFTPETYESGLREDLLVRKYQSLVLNGIVLSDLEIDQRFRVEHQQAEIDYVHVDPERFDLQDPPDEAAIRQFYDDNPNSFTQPEQIRIRYFTLSLADVENRTKVRERAVERYYERNRDSEFTTPRRVRASQIMKRVDPEADDAVREAARQSLLAVLEQARGGADFAELAREHSEDGSSEQGGDLGFFRRDEMIPAIADTAFALEPGQVSNIVASPFGLHIVKVTEVEAAVVQPLEEVRAVIEDKLRAQRAERSLDLEAERLPDRMAQEGIDAVAASLGRSVIETPLFDATTELEGLGPAGPLYAQLRKRRAGDHGVWRRNPVQGHVFYRIEEVTERFVKPYEQAREQARLLAENARRREEALERARQAIGAISSADDLSAFAERNGLAVQSTRFTSSDVVLPGLGVNRELQRKAFALTPEAPFGLAISNKRAYLLHLKGMSVPEGEEADTLRTEIAATLRNEWRNAVLKRESKRLRDRVQIELVSPAYVASGS